MDQDPLKNPAEPAVTAPPEHELGLGKHDSKAGLLDRLKKQFQPAPSSNPKLVNYLAAGSIQGLRPLRYEKRVLARNRFFALAAILCTGISRNFLRAGPSALTLRTGTEL